MQTPPSFSEIPSAKMPSVNTKLLLSVGTVPLLLLLIGSKLLAEIMQEVGQATEEVFRGDRLPILKIFDLTSSDTVSDAGDD